ncbi:MAG: transcriptional regulator, partial [Acidimicrobiales bacterium]|nr:transcriptional regulator [Acidimicrobiales bacterium]
MPPRHPLLVALGPVAARLGATLVPPSRLGPSDVPLSWEGEVVGGLRLPGVHGTLDRLIATVEAEL